MMAGLEKADVITDDDSVSGSHSNSDLSDDSGDNSIDSDPEDPSDGSGSSHSDAKEHTLAGFETKEVHRRRNDRHEVSDKKHTRKATRVRKEERIVSDPLNGTSEENIEAGYKNIKKEDTRVESKIVPPGNEDGFYSEEDAPILPSQGASMKQSKHNGRSSVISPNQSWRGEHDAYVRDTSSRTIAAIDNDKDNRTASGTIRTEKHARYKLSEEPNAERRSTGNGEGGDAETKSNMEVQQNYRAQAESQKNITLLDAAEIVLQDAGSDGLHLKEILTRCAQRGLIDASKKKSLDALIYRETQRGSQRFTKVDGQPGYFALAKAEDKIQMLKRKAARADKVRLERHRRRASNERKLRYMKKTVRMMLFTNTAMHEEREMMLASIKALSRNKRHLIKRLKQKGEPIPSFIEEDVSSEDSDKENSRRNTAQAQTTHQQVPTKLQVPHTQTVPQQQLGTQPAMRKRRSPGTSTKDVEVSVDGNGLPAVPVKVGPVMVMDFGTVEWEREGFHSERYIWPIGFTSERMGNSYLTEERVLYTCKILDGGEAPLFEIRAADDPENPVVASSPTSSIVTLLIKIKTARTGNANVKVAASGPAFFGLSQPYVMKAFLLLPNADKLTQYNPDYLDEVRSEREAKWHASTDGQSGSAPTRKRRRRTSKHAAIDEHHIQAHAHTRTSMRNALKTSAVKGDLAAPQTHESSTSGVEPVNNLDSNAGDSHAVAVRSQGPPAEPLKLTLVQRMLQRPTSNKRPSGYS